MRNKYNATCYKVDSALFLIWPGHKTRSSVTVKLWTWISREGPCPILIVYRRKGYCGIIFQNWPKKIMMETELLCTSGVIGVTKIYFNEMDGTGTVFFPGDISACTKHQTGVL